jgi:hypothetical protein
MDFFGFLGAAAGPSRAFGIPDPGMLESSSIPGSQSAKRSARGPSSIIEKPSSQSKSPIGISEENEKTTHKKNKEHDFKTTRPDQSTTTRDTAI